MVSEMSRMLTVTPCRPALAGPVTVTDCGVMVTSAPIRDSTSANRRSPCGECDPSPGMVMLRPVRRGRGQGMALAVEASGSIR